MANWKLEDGMVVIGMDPSSYKNCGWAVLKYENGQVLLLDKFTQVFQYPIDMEEPWNCFDRFRQTYQCLEEMIQKHHPKYLCLERSIGGGLTFIRGNLSETVGIAKLCCCDHGCGVFETSPSHVKKQITGSGKAKKKHIMANVLGFFKLDKTGTEHECDAACCALSFFMDAGWTGYQISSPMKVKGKGKSSTNIKKKGVEIKNVTKPEDQIKAPSGCNQ